MSKRRPRRMKGVRSHHLKMFHSEVVNTGSSVNKERMKQYSERARGIGQPTPRTILAGLGFERSPLKEVLDQLKQTERLQWNDKLHSVFLKTSAKGETYRLFWNGDYAFITKEIPDKDIALRSILYKNTTRAKLRFERGETIWHDVQELNTSVSHNPTPS